MWPVPPPSLASLRTKDDFKHAVNDLTSKVVDGKGLILVTGSRGMPIVATEVFFALMGRFHCIWLDLDEEFDVSDFVTLVLECIARETGMPPGPPLAVDMHCFSGENAPVPAALDSRLKYLTDHSSRRFVVFINARHFPGREERVWPKHWYRELESATRWLAGKDSVTVTLLAWRGSPVIPSTVSSHLDRDLKARAELREPAQIASALREKILEKAMGGDLRLAKFTLGISLFRYPCYLSALQSWALQKASNRYSVKDDNDLVRFEVAKNELLPVLRTAGAIRDDEGQSVFMYPALRRCILAQNREHQGGTDWPVPKPTRESQTGTSSSTAPRATFTPRSSGSPSAFTASTLRRK